MLQLINTGRKSGFGKTKKKTIRSTLNMLDMYLMSKTSKGV